MLVVVNSGPAAIHADFSRLQGRKFVIFAGQSIKQFERHKTAILLKTAGIGKGLPPLFLTV
jgi:hypothetical protein